MHTATYYFGLEAHSANQSALNYIIRKLDNRKLGASVL